MSLKETAIKLTCVLALFFCFMQSASADWYDDIKPNSTWVKIEGENFVADTFMGVSALYNESDNSRYHCGELIIRFYKEAYGLDIYPYTNDTPTSQTDGYEFVKTKTPKKGDIIFVSKEMRGSTQDHWAIVKDYSDGYITLFEQNTIWEGQAGVERKLKCPSDSYYIYTLVKVDGAPVPGVDGVQTENVSSPSVQSSKPAETTTAIVTVPETKVTTTVPVTAPPTTAKPVTTTGPATTGVVTTKAETTVATESTSADVSVTSEESTTQPLSLLTELNTTQKATENKTAAEKTTAQAESGKENGSETKKVLLAVGVCIGLVAVAAMAMIIAKKKR